MSLKEEIRAELIDLAVTDIKIDRESDINGSPATEVRVWIDADHDGAVVNTEHIFHFAKANAMDAYEMASVIDSYVHSGIDRVMA